MLSLDFLIQGAMSFSLLIRLGFSGGGSLDSLAICLTREHEERIPLAYFIGEGVVGKDDSQAAFSESEGQPREDAARWIASAR